MNTNDAQALESTLNEFLKKIDYPLLKKQTGLLAELQTKLTVRDDKFKNVIQVLLNLISGLNNHVVAFEIVPEEYVFPEDGMTIVTWPESQTYMMHPDFREEAILINDEHGLPLYGCSAYWIPDRIIKEVDFDGVGHE